MDTNQQVSQAAEFFRAREEERRENSMFRHAIKSAVAGAAAYALFARRGA